MVSKSCAVACPVVLGHTLKVDLRISSQCWHRPDTDVASTGAACGSTPISDLRAVWRKTESPQRGIHKFRCAAMSQVVKLSRSDLRDPHIDLAVSIREKRHKVAIARDRSRLLHAFEIRNGLKLCVGDRASPEILRTLQPHPDAKYESGRCS